MSLSKELPQLSDQELEHRAYILAERKRIIERTLNACWRAGATGFAIRGGLNLVTSVLGALVKRRKGVKAARSTADAFYDTLRYAVFFSSLASTYVLLEECIAAVFGKERSSHWRALVAGALSGPTIMLTGPGTRHTSLSVYILLRGCTLLARCGNRPTNPSWLRGLLGPTRLQHGDTMLMCLATIQLAYSWIFLPQTLPVSYVRFLNKHGGKDLAQYAAVREVCMRNAAGHPAAPLSSLQGTQYARLSTTLPCHFLHAGKSCGSHAQEFVWQAYARALPVYLPVYVVPALLVHRRALLQPPGCWVIWRKIGMGLLRSSGFLALYCTLAWRGACAGFQWSGQPTALVMCATCWVAGLATLVEKKSRRMELALYCLSRSLESFALSALELGWIKPHHVPPRMDVLMFSLGVAAIMHTYSDGNGNRRACFHSKYLNVLDFIFGNTGMEQGQIYHNPSTNQLLTRMVSSPSLQKLHSLASTLALTGRMHSTDSSSIGQASTPSTSSSPNHNNNQPQQQFTGAHEEDVGGVGYGGYATKDGVYNEEGVYSAQHGVYSEHGDVSAMIQGEGGWSADGVYRGGRAAEEAPGVGGPHSEETPRVWAPGAWETQQGTMQRGTRVGGGVKSLHSSPEDTLRAWGGGEFGGGGGGVGRRVARNEVSFAEWRTNVSLREMEGDDYVGGKQQGKQEDQVLGKQEDDESGGGGGGDAAH